MRLIIGSRFKQTVVGKLPEDWCLVQLKDVARLINGRAYSYKEFKKSGTPLVRIQNLTGTEDFVFSDLELEEEKHIGKGDLIFAWSGTFGPRIWEGPKAIYHYHIWKVICDPSALDKTFFYHELQYMSNRISNTGTGSIFTHITKRLMEDSRIPLPSLEEQKAIANVLSSLDMRIEFNHRMNKILEAIIKALFKYWFVDFEFPNEQGKPYKSSGGEMVYNEGFGSEMPKGWMLGNLGDIAENPRRPVQPSELEPGTPYIGLEHMPRRSLAISDWGAAEQVVSNKFQFHKGEILFGKLRPYFHKVGIAPVDGVCSTDILVVVPRSSEWYGLVLSHLSSDQFVDIVDAASTGTKMPRTNWNDMTRYEIPIPPEHVARRFSDKILPLVQRFGVNIMQSRTLSNIRTSLLPKLMSGKVRVSVEAR